MEIPSNEEEIYNLIWEGGPTHHLQKQHIPGYCGHVKSLKAENLHGHPFAKLTAEALENRTAKGFIIDDEERFKTTSGIAFSHPKGEEYSKTLQQNAINVLTSTQSYA